MCDNVTHMSDKEVKNTNKSFTDKDKKYIEDVINVISANVSEWVKALKNGTNPKITTREISRRTGVSIAVISDIEHNNYLPKMEVLLKLAYGMKRDFAKVLNTMWDTKTAKDWENKIGKPLANEIVERETSDNEMSLDRMLAREGLNKNEIKEVIEFISFKKLRQKRR